ncbi:MAG TPA: hypothetical protein VMH04_02855 [Candidatus Solibacter sp.]|nr:hypothetical protein [Candidatus Solibacter sp.]
MSHMWPWVVLAALGAYHGLNPAMGWLFALAIGLQEKRRAAVAGALFPIALGHAAAIALTIVVLNVVQRFVSGHALKWTLASIIFGLGVYRLVRASHPRGGGMRVGGRDLFLWSFLMASAHGAGLMLMPILLSPTAGLHHHMPDSMSLSPAPPGVGLILSATFVHTVAMLIVAGTLAMVFFAVYDRFGLGLLRHAWFNFDLLWAIALLIAAVAVAL